MSDLENRLPGRMVLTFALHPLATPIPCHQCQGAEPAVGQFLALFPPLFTGDPTSASDLASFFEEFIVEQARGVFRLSTFEALGIHCLAASIALHQDRKDTVAIATALAHMTLPERLVGTWAVAPGVEGRLFPMVLGLDGPLSIGQMYRLLNQPFGTLDAGLAEVLPDPQEAQL